MVPVGDVQELAKCLTPGSQEEGRIDALTYARSLLESAATEAPPTHPHTVRVVRPVEV